ncbi:MAG: 5'/3'-nucleotidase SurE, partial [Bacteroidia bacterium]|nr:5'/3'-nucleotidase SurE [Bacteroidia bacterium]
IYSATMGSAIEACFYGIKAVGLSIADFSSDADFTAAKLYSKSIIRNVLKNGLPDGVCLNVNVPSLPLSDIKGVKICRQTKGIWKEEFDKRVDPRGNEYYWLTGNFKNFEPGANDTDEWALKNKFVSIVPVQIDMTAYSVIEILNKWNYEI